MWKITAFILMFIYQINTQSFVSNNIGNLHLSGKKWEIQYVLNLTEYKETSELLRECVDTLTKACKGGQNPLCPYFIHETKNLNTELQADISKLNVLTRQKRLIWLLIVPVLIGTTLLGL